MTEIDRITTEPSGKIDEIVCDCPIHIEDLGNSYYLALDTDDDHYEFDIMAEDGEVVIRPYPSTTISTPRHGPDDGGKTADE